MPPATKRPRKTTKRPPKKKPGKKGALIKFTATQKGTARRPRGDDGDVWVLIGPISWIKYTHRPVDYRTKRAAVKALKKFKKG